MSATFPAYAGKTWFELDAEGHQRWPGDFEAQCGQGAITFHSEEHLASSDRGIALWRKVFRQAARTVGAGGDPPLAFGNGAVSIEVRAAALMVAAGDSVAS